MGRTGAFPEKSTDNLHAANLAGHSVSQTSFPGQIGVASQSSLPVQTPALQRGETAVNN